MASSGTRTDELTVKFKSIQTAFNIESLQDFQIEGIKALLKNCDVYIGTKTGSGKSIIYECMQNVKGMDTVTLVIAPIQSIMEEQVEGLYVVHFKTYI